MAKALIGHLHSDLRSTSRLATENARLRLRVEELETLVLRLQDQRDALLEAQAAALVDLEPGLEQMQPA